MIRGQWTGTEALGADSTALPNHRPLPTLSPAGLQCPLGRCGDSNLQAGWAWLWSGAVICLSAVSQVGSRKQLGTLSAAEEGKAG